MKPNRTASATSQLTDPAQLRRQADTFEIVPRDGQFSRGFAKTSSMFG
jgi:hypothetical protein